MKHLFLLLSFLSFSQLSITQSTVESDEETYVKTVDEALLEGELVSVKMTITTKVRNGEREQVKKIEEFFNQDGRLIKKIEVLSLP